MSRVQFLPRLRVVKGGDIALGPGKADLLETIERCGSIAEAAREMGMSYARAWKLVRTMNACFKAPLVESARGGASRGGARLSLTGRRALELYRSMESSACIVIARDAARLRRLLK